MSFVFAITPTLAYSANLTSCSLINISGNYTITQDIASTTSAMCLNVAARDVTIDCLGGTIRGNDTYGAIGIYSSNDNLNIRNCTIIDWYTGIKKEGSNNGVVQYSKLISNAIGISLENSENNQFFSSVLSGNDLGARISFSEGNLFYNNLFNNTNNTLFIGANRNTWNIVRQRGNRIYSPSSYIGGNYWKVLPYGGYSESCTDSNKDGFCDAAYQMDSSNIDYFALSGQYVPDTTLPSVTIESPKSGEILNSTNISITLTASDPVYWYTNISIMRGDELVKSIISPQNGTFTVYLNVNSGNYYNVTATAYDLEGNTNTTAAVNVLTPISISSCDDLTIPGEKYFLDRDIYYNSGSICINIQADNIILDCLGRKIGGRDAPYKTYGISMNNRRNVTIRNCQISDWTYNIFGQFVSNSAVNQCIISKSKDAGIYLYSSSNNLIFENVIGNNSKYGLKLYNSADNKIYNNIFENNMNIFFEGDRLKNYWNTNRKVGYRVSNLKGREIGGNFWGGVNNDYSRTCADNSSTGFCDTSYDVESETNSPPQGMFIARILTGNFIAALSGLVSGIDSNNIDYLPMSNKFAPDTIPPATNMTIYMPNGSLLNSSDWTKESSVNVTLNCSDNFGSGCNTTLYCYSEVANCTPSKIYKINVTVYFDKTMAQTIYFRYFSTDKEGNLEAIKDAAIKSLSSGQKAVIEIPRDLSYLNSANITVTTNVLSSSEVNYTELIVYNSSGSVINQYNSTSKNTSSQNILLPGEGNYTLMLVFHSLFGFVTNESSSAITIDTTSPIINFNLNPDRVSISEKITATCTATDAYKGTFLGQVSAISTDKVGNWTASCTATDNAGNTVTDTKEYVVYIENCVEGVKRCNNNNVEVCKDYDWVIDKPCSKTRCDSDTLDCAPSSEENTTPDDENNSENNGNNTGGNIGLLSNPTMIAGGALLLLFAVVAGFFLYKKVLKKPEGDYSKRMAILEAKIDEAGNNGKDVSSIRSELELAQSDINMGLFEMVEPKLKEIEKNLKSLK